MRRRFYIIHLICTLLFCICDGYSYGITYLLCWWVVVLLITSSVYDCINDIWTFFICIMFFFFAFADPKDPSLCETWKFVFYLSSVSVCNIIRSKSNVLAIIQKILVWVNLKMITLSIINLSHITIFWEMSWHELGFDFLFFYPFQLNFFI